MSAARLIKLHFGFRAIFCRTLYVSMRVLQIVFQLELSESHESVLRCCRHLELPSSRQRWITAVTCLSPRQPLLWESSPWQPLLVCGDRCGNVHVYQVLRNCDEMKDSQHSEVLPCIYLILFIYLFIYIFLYLFI